MGVKEDEAVVTRASPKSTFIDDYEIELEKCYRMLMEFSLTIRNAVSDGIENDGPFCRWMTDFVETEISKVRSRLTSISELRTQYREAAADRSISSGLGELAILVGGYRRETALRQQRFENHFNGFKANLAQFAKPVAPVTKIIEKIREVSEKEEVEVLPLKAETPLPPPPHMDNPWDLMFFYRNDSVLDDLLSVAHQLGCGPIKTKIVTVKYRLGGVSGTFYNLDGKITDFHYSLSREAFCDRFLKVLLTNDPDTKSIAWRSQSGNRGDFPLLADKDGSARSFHVIMDSLLLSVRPTEPIPKMLKIYIGQITVEVIRNRLSGQEEMVEMVCVAPDKSKYGAFVRTQTEFIAEIYKLLNEEIKRNPVYRIFSIEVWNNNEIVCGYDIGIDVVFGKVVNKENKEVESSIRSHWRKLFSGTPSPDAQTGKENKIEISFDGDKIELIHQAYMGSGAEAHCLYRISLKGKEAGRGLPWVFNRLAFLNHLKGLLALQKPKALLITSKEKSLALVYSHDLPAAPSYRYSNNSMLAKRWENIQQVITEEWAKL